MDDRVDSLVKFLANPNRKADDHVDTVMEMVRELAKYKHELEESRKREKEARNELTMFADERDPFTRSRNRRMQEPGYPQMIEIPANARAVEIKL